MNAGLSGALPSVLPAPLRGRSSGVLLVIAPAEETAKRIESHLRNAGHPLRAGWLTELDEVEDVLRRNPPDVVLCVDDLRSAPFERVVRMCHTLCEGLPVLLLSTSTGLDAEISALEQGARGLVACGTPQQLRHLELVVIREFLTHHHYRQLKLTRERLADFESRHRQLTTGTADAVAHVLEGIVTSANPAFAALLGHDTAEGIEGQPLVDLVAPDQQSRVKERLRAVLKGKHNGEPLEFALQGRAGTVPVKAQLILGQQDGEHVIEMLIRTGAIGPAQAPAPPVTPAALAGAPRRAAMLAALKQPLPDARLTRAALLVALDNFDALETAIGLVEAEEAASLVTAAVRARLGPQDGLYPFSTSEFGLVLHRAHAAEIERFAELLCREIAQMIVATQSHESQVTVSLTVYPLNASDDPLTVIAQLLEEVRRLASSGGNRVSVLGETAKIAQQQREEARRAAQVKKALDDNRLKLAFQSIASLEGEERGYFDVLLRFIDENGKEYHASEFLPAAQKFQLMRVLDRWVINRMMSLLGKQGAAQKPLLFVKMSEDTLREPEAFLGWLKELSARMNVGIDDLVLQFQEQVLQNHLRRARQFADLLKAMGGKLCIEHYGIGVNSAQLLASLPVDFVKFHGSFTQNFGDARVQKKFTELLAGARSRQIRTIVSYVEDANALAKLWQMGAHYVQGYHIQEPEVVLLASGVEVGR